MSGYHSIKKCRRPGARSLSMPAYHAVARPSLFGMGQLHKLRCLLPLLVILATALPRSYMDGSLFIPLSILILLPPSHSPYALPPLRRTPVSPPTPHRPFGLSLTAMAHPVPLGVAQSSYSVTLGILIFIPGRESVWPRPLSSATAHNARIRCQHLPPWLTIAAVPVPRLCLRHTLRAPSMRHSRKC